MTGTAVVLALTRRFGRPFVDRLVPEGKMDRLDALAERRGRLFFFLIFLLPFLPDDLTCLAVGLTPLPIGEMLVLIALGRLPGLFVASWIGSESGEFGPTGWIGLIAGVVILASAFLVWRESIEEQLLRLIRRLTGRERRR